MQLTKQADSNQVGCCSGSPSLIGGVGDRLASPAPHHGGVGDRDEVLLYHSENNSDSTAVKKANKLSNLQAKTMKALDANSKHWMKKYGENHVGILTLTFKENLTCDKEAQRRWNNLNRLINRHSKFTILVKVKEYQKRGAVHYHMLVKTNENIRGKIDWEIYEQMGKEKDVRHKRKLGKELAKTAEPHLVELWGWLREKCKRTGFGRSELMPLKKPHHVKNYIGKYLEKDMQSGKSKSKSSREISYGRKADKVANTKFSWINGKSSIYRRKRIKFTESRGIKNQEEMTEIYGKSWSYHLYPHIMHDKAMAIYRDATWDELQDPDKRLKVVLPFKGQIVSGAMTERCRDSVMDMYLQDDLRKREDNKRNHSDHYYRWVKAEAHKALNEKIYG